LLLPRGGGSALLEKHVSMSSGAFRRTQSESSSLHAPSARSVPSIQPEGTTSSLVMGRSSGPTILDEVGRRRLKELEGEISSLKEDLEDAKAAQERANRAMRSKDLDTKSMKAELEKERKNHQRTRSLAEDLARTVGQIKGTIQERAAEMAQIQIQSAKVKTVVPRLHASSNH
jgi:chromosome segregation ATPase